MSLPTFIKITLTGYLSERQVEEIRRAGAALEADIRAKAHREPWDPPSDVSIASQRILGELSGFIQGHVQMGQGLQLALRVGRADTLVDYGLPFILGEHKSGNPDYHARALFELGGEPFKLTTTAPRLAASLEAAGWSHIDTVPRDGTRVELLSANGKADSGYWSAYDGRTDGSIEDHLSTDNGEGNYIAWRHVTMDTRP